MMAVALIQLLPAVVGCVAVWWLWRSVRVDDRALAATGFLLRALAGTAVFWVSWLELPIAKGLQLGGGFWFYGLDGTNYYRDAEAILSGGFTELILIDRTIAAGQYVQLLAIGRMLAGSSIAVALLINLLSYMGTVAIVSHWSGEGDGRGRRLAIGALALMPTWVLWSTQPLKESFFVLLIVLFVDGLRRWAAHWEGDGGYRAAGIGAAEMFASLFLMGGVRWYFGFILWYAFLAAWLLASLVRRRIRTRELAASLVLFFLLSQALILTMWMDYVQSTELMFKVVVWLQSSKESFEVVNAATTIFPGPLLAGLPLPDVIARGVACVLPRFIAMPAGLVSIGGGRGLWALAEVDTIFLGIFAALAARAVWRVRTEAKSDVNALLLAVSFLGALSMLWVVNNFGTLLRLREMMLLPIILAPIVIRRSRGDRVVAETDERANKTDG